MQKTSRPAISEAVALLQDALAAGHAVTLSLNAPPRVDRAAPLVAACCLAFGVTQAEARVLVELTEHSFVAKENLLAAMSPHGRPKTGTLNTAVCRLRQKLQPHGIEIVTVYGLGFQLNENARGRLRQLLPDHSAGDEVPELDTP
jgi:Transcriptional regulatory protein, C terminal